MVKTDFKNTYEAFMHCDTNKLKKEFAAMYSDNEEQAAAVKDCLLYTSDSADE